MAKGSGTTRVSSPGSPRQREAMQLYDFWLRGGSNYVNGQIDANFAGGFFAGGNRDLELLDTVFEPSSAEIKLFKGVPEDMTEYLMRQTGVKSAGDLVGKSYVDKFYSSTSDNIRAAQSYAERNIEFSDHCSLVHFTVAKGTPIRRAVGYTDQETTLRRNLKYTITGVRTTADDEGTITHHFYITVSKK